MGAQQHFGTKRHFDGAMAELGSLSELFSDETSYFTQAQSLTTYLRGCMIQEEAEGFLKGSPEFLIASKYHYRKSSPDGSNEAPTQVFHHVEYDGSLGWKDSLLNEVLFSTRDFPARPVAITVQVYEIDGISDRVIDGVRQVLRQGKNAAAVTYPVLAPLASGLEIAVPEFLDLMNHLDDHDPILDRRIRFDKPEDEPAAGDRLLQPGYYVLFRHPVERTLHLNRDLQVVDENGNRFTETSYAVLEADRQFFEGSTFNQVINQKAAKLMNQVNGRGQSDTKSSLDFLQDTLRAYTVTRKLERLRELQEKNELSSAERRLRDDLKEELAENDTVAPLLEDTVL